MTPDQSRASHPLVENRPAHIRERDQCAQQPGHADGRHECPVRVERVDANHALAHVDEALRDAYHEEAVGLLVVVARELPQHLRQARIVRPRADQTHRVNGVQRNVQVVVVRVFGQRVEDRKDGVGSAQKTDG